MSNQPYEIKKYFYVYYSYEKWGRGYIGSRGCKCLPSEDIKYFGSFSDKTFKPTQKIILQTYNSRGDAIIDEVKLHNFYEVDINPHFANRSKQTSAKFYFDPTGIIRSVQTREKISGKNSPMLGKTHSEETRKKLSEIGKKLVGDNNPFFGKTHSENTKQKLSEAQKGRVLSEETRQKLSEAGKGRSHSEETKRKMSEAQKRRYSLK